MSTDDSRSYRYVVAGSGIMVVHIQKMLDGAPSPLEDQAPAIECFVLLRGMGNAIHGSLSVVKGSGLLRMLSRIAADPNGPNATQRGRAPSFELIEQFFEANDVMSIAVKHEITRAVDLIKG